MSDFEYTKLHESRGIGEEPNKVLWTAHYLEESKKDKGHSMFNNSAVKDYTPYTNDMASGYLNIVRDMNNKAGFILLNVPQLLDLFKRIEARRKIVRKKGESIPPELKVKDAFIWHSASCEEVIKWNVRPHRFIVDVDADIEMPELFGRMYDNIPNFGNRHRAIMQTLIVSRKKEIERYNPNALKMLSAVVLSMRESFKVMLMLYGLVGDEIASRKTGLDESIVIRATHYDSNGDFIEEPKKWSFHLVYKNVIMTNNVMARVFGCLMRTFLISWYMGIEVEYRGVTIAEIPKSYDDIINFVFDYKKNKNKSYEPGGGSDIYDPELCLTQKEIVEQAIRCLDCPNREELLDRLDLGVEDDKGNARWLRKGWSGMSNTCAGLGPESFEEEFFEDMESPEHILLDRIQDIIDMNIYNTSHNIRLPSCTKPNEDRYSEVITLGHTNIDGLSSTYMFNDLDVQEYVFLNDDEYDDAEVSENNDGKMSKVVMDDKFVREAISIALEKYENFDYRSQRPQKDGSLIVNFNRLEPDTKCCPLCESKKPHENDNNLFMVINANESGTRFATMYCLKAKVHGANRPKKCIAVSGGSSADDMQERIKKSLEESKKDRYSVLFDPNDYVGDLEDNFTRCISESGRNIHASAFDKTTVTYIVAGMGIGKTVTLIDYIKKHPKKKIIMLSNRIALTNEIISKMNKAMKTPEEHFMSYQDTKERLVGFKRLVIQTESLNRLSTESLANEDFLLILDESESIIKQFSSTTHRDNLNKNIMIFMYLIYKAKNIIALDATMTMATHNVIKAVMDDYKRKDVTYTFYQNDCKTQNDMTFNMTASRNSWLSKLIDCVRRGKKCVVALNSKNTARSLKIALETEFKDTIEIGHYDSETLASVKRKHFSDVNKYWSKYDVLLYTPTAGAGISFEKKHYDYLFGYFVSCSCDAEACIQLLGRVRDIRSKEAYIYADPIKNNVKTTKEAILNSRLESHNRDLNAGILEPDRINTEGLLEYKLTPKLELQLTNIATRNRSRKDLFDRIVRILHIYCDNVKLYVADPKIKSYEFSTFIEKNKMELAEAIAEAPCITNKDFNNIKDRSMAGDDIETEERRSIDKFMLSNVFNIEQKAQDYEFVLRYNCDKEKEQCSNLCAIPDTDNLTESLELMNTVKRVSAYTKIKDLGNSLLDYTTASKIDIVTDVVELMTMLKIKTIKKVREIDLENFEEMAEEFYDLCEIIAKKLENRSLDRLLGRRGFLDNFIESFGKFFKELMKIMFGMNVILSGNWMTVYRRADYAYQVDIFDRDKSNAACPKIMASKFLLGPYYGDKFAAEPTSCDGLADDSEEASIGDMKSVTCVQEVDEQYDSAFYYNIIQ